MIDTKVIRDEKEFVLCADCEGDEGYMHEDGGWVDCEGCEGSGGHWEYVEDEDEG